MLIRAQEEDRGQWFMPACLAGAPNCLPHLTALDVNVQMPFHLCLICIGNCCGIIEPHTVIAKYKKTNSLSCSHSGLSAWLKYPREDRQSGNNHNKKFNMFYLTICLVYITFSKIIKQFKTQRNSQDVFLFYKNIHHRIVLNNKLF